MARDTALLRERLARHGLAARPAGTPAAAAALTTAVQAQDAAAARLGLRARGHGFTEADARAAEQHGAVVRTWLLRATLHLVPAADLRWLVRLMAPSITRRYAARRRQLGLTDAVLARVCAELPDVLRDGPLPRDAVLPELVRRGVLGRAGGELHVHALLHASTTGLVCRGPDRGRTPTYALTDTWLDPPGGSGPSGDDALAELARRYFAAYSPATAADFRAWSGLPGGRAVALVRDELTPVDVRGRPGYRLGAVEPARGVRLLPAFDDFVLGHADRAPLVDGEHHGAVYRGGMIAPTLVDDGRVVGTWALRRCAGVLAVRPFGPLTARVTRALDAEVADVARFLDTPLEPAVTPPDDP